MWPEAHADCIVTVAHKLQIKKGKNLICLRVGGSSFVIRNITVPSISTLMFCAEYCNKTLFGEITQKKLMKARYYK